MKRGLGLVATFLVLAMPTVIAAESVLELFLGTSEESLILLRIMYAMLFFVLVLKVAKKQIFPEEDMHRLAVAFSILLSFLVMRFTPDPWVAAFGWVLALVAPVIIMWVLSGVFIKGEEGKFSWGRLLITALGTILLFYALGSSAAFGDSIGKTPIVGGFLDEIFSDAIYFGLYNLPSWLLIPGIMLLVFTGLYLLSRLFGGDSGERGGSFSLGNIIPFILFLLLLALLLGYGGFIGIPAALGTILTWLLGGLGALALLAILGFGSYGAYQAGFFGWLRRLWRPWMIWPILIILGLLLLGGLAYFAFLKVPWWVYAIIAGIALLLFLLSLFAGAVGGTGYGLFRFFRGGNNLYVVLRVPARTAAGRNWPLMTIAPNMRFRDINVATRATNAFPLTFQVYIGRRWLISRRLEGATIEIAATTGALSDTTGTTTAAGEFNTTFTPPNANANGVLRVVRVTHPDLNPLATRVRPYNLIVGAGVQPAPTLTIQGGAITSNPGQTVQLVINMTNDLPDPVMAPATLSSGRGFGRIQVEIAGLAGIAPTDPINATTIGGTRPVLSTIVAGVITAGTDGNPSIATFAPFTVPAGTAAGTYPFTVTANATARGFRNPTPISGTLNIVIPTLRNMQLRVRTAQITTGTPLPLTPAPNPRAQIRAVGEQGNIEVEVREAPVGGAIPGTGARINTATINSTDPRVGPFTRTGPGTYRAVFTPNATDRLAVDLPIIVANARFNNATETAGFHILDTPALTFSLSTSAGNTMYVGQTNNITVQLNNLAGTPANIPGNNIQINYTRIGTRGTSPFVNRPAQTTPAGRLEEPFAPVAPGQYTFRVEVTAPGFNFSTQDINIRVNPAGNLQIRPTVSAAQITQGQTSQIGILVGEPGVGAVAGANITITPLNAFPAGCLLLPPPLTTNAAGQYVADFTPTAAVAPGTYNFRIEAENLPTHRAATPVQVSIIVLPSPPLQLAARVTRAQIPPTESSDIQVQVQNSLTSAPVDAANVTITPLDPIPHGSIAPLVYTTNPAGQAVATFTAPAGTPLQIFRFQIDATLTPGFTPAPSQQVQIEVISQPDMVVTIDWMPHPTSRRMMMNILVLDSNTSNPVQSAELHLTDTHPNPINITGNNITDVRGMLPVPIQIDLGRSIPRGARPEDHIVNVVVEHAGYVDTVGAITLQFVNRRTPHGGRQSITL
jgi:hypothetical protein